MDYRNNPTVDCCARMELLMLNQTADMPLNGAVPRSGTPYAPSRYIWVARGLLGA